MPVAEVEKGMVGTGYTVSEGTDPEPFSVEVLGVMEDGIGPGRDLIVVNTSSPAIDAAEGIWYGMSGSPVYIDDEFVGALAYGLSYGASTDRRSDAGRRHAEDRRTADGTRSIPAGEQSDAEQADGPGASPEATDTVRRGDLDGHEATAHAAQRLRARTRARWITCRRP